VLKPGGHLITTGDSYRSRNTSQDVEFEVFERHTSVLLGVNESIPSFSAFESILNKYRDSLEIKVLTPWIYNAACGKNGSITNITEIRWWDYDRDHEMLGNATGSIGLNCELTKSIAVPTRLQSEAVLSAGSYAASLSDHLRAIQKLAPLVPSELVNRPFPGRYQTKLELLNGWQTPRRWMARPGYKRARWFLRRKEHESILCFSVRRLRPATNTTAELAILMNGKLVVTVPLDASAWRNFRLPLEDIEVGSVFVCELQLSIAASKQAEFDDHVFLVKRREFSTNYCKPEGGSSRGIDRALERSDARPELYRISRLTLLDRIYPALPSISTLSRLSGDRGAGLALDIELPGSNRWRTGCRINLGDLTLPTHLAEGHKHLARNGES
jgi:hypothetical protein